MHYNIHNIFYQESNMKNNKVGSKLGCFLILAASFYSVLSHADTINFPQDSKGTVTLAKNLHQYPDGKLDGWRLIKEQDKDVCQWITYKNNTISKKDDTMCQLWVQSQHQVVINTPNGVTEIALPLVKMSDNAYSESIVAQVNFDNKGNIYNVKVNRGHGSIINLDKGPEVAHDDAPQTYSSSQKPINITIKTPNGETTKINVPLPKTNPNDDEPILAQVNFDHGGNVITIKNRAKGDVIDLGQVFSEEYPDIPQVQYNAVSLELRQKIVSRRPQTDIAVSSTEMRNKATHSNSTNDETDDVLIRRNLLNLP